MRNTVKKLSVVFLSVCIIISLTAMPISAVGVYSLGDVNGDGAITAEDVTALARHVAKIEIMTDSRALSAGNVDKTGGITSEDVTMLARYVAKIITSLDDEGGTHEGVIPDGPGDEDDKI